MDKIVFLNEPEIIYDGEFYQIGDNQIRLIFSDKIPETETITSGFNLVNEHNGLVMTNCEDYKYIYRTYEDNKKIELCNDEVPWVEPKFTVKFVINEEHSLEGETIQEVGKFQDIKVPTPKLLEGFEFVKWRPELPEEGYLVRDMTFYAAVEDNNVYFHCSGGGELEGETRQFVNDYGRLVVPTPKANENYKFVEWMPEIPKEGTVGKDSDKHFYAVFESNIPDRMGVVESDLTDAQMGLVENYDLAVSTSEEVTDLQLALVEVYNLIGGGI